MFNRPARPKGKVLSIGVLGLCFLATTAASYVSPDQTSKTEERAGKAVFARNGLNYIDLNGDGLQDMVVSEYRGNVSARSFNQRA